MSTIEQIDHAVEVLGKEDLILLHACSTYPAYYEELNLRVIPTLRERYGVPVGYSGHETGHPLDGGGGRAGRLLRRAAHHARPRDVGLRPGGLARAQRHHALVRDIRLVETVDGRRREAGLRARAADHQEAAAGGRGADSEAAIKAIALDVDGVLTDGGVWWGPNGEEWKRFSFADIMGVSLAPQGGPDRSR